MGQSNTPNKLVKLFLLETSTVGCCEVLTSLLCRNFLWREEKLKWRKFSGCVWQATTNLVTSGLRSEPCAKWQGTIDNRLRQTFVLS